MNHVTNPTLCHSQSLDESHMLGNRGPRGFSCHGWDAFRSSHGVRTDRFRTDGIGP